MNVITNVIEWWNPLVLAAKVYVSNNPRWHETMNGPDTAGYWEVMRIEIASLTNKVLGNNPSNIRYVRP